MSRKSQTAFAVALAYAAFPQTLQAQTTARPEAPLEVTVTANRIPTALQRTGSAITVLRQDEIQRTNPSSFVDVLRTVPGLDITETGGPGSTTSIRLRGANSGQTLVMIDGVRVNDASGASGEFDASIISPALIDRIEVLRGPQSALYGSDAMGGVINIITKRGRGSALTSVRVEGGSYGTLNTIASTIGSSGPWSYALSGTAQRSEGFSRYGYRIGRLERQQGPFEADATARFGGFGRIGYDPGNGFRIEVSGLANQTHAEYDAFNADAPQYSSRRFSQINVKAELDTFDRMLTHTVQLFGNRTERYFFESSFARVGGILRETRTRSDFIGDRLGAEYQAQLRLQQFGSLIAGVRQERETADTFTRRLLQVPGARTRTLAAEQDTTSLFALWQLPVGERLMLSLGGRHDKVSDAGAFNTWRATAAYALTETGTKLRASAGTGGKAPTLFQRFSPDYGTPGLSPEASIGYDVGIDQTLLDGRVTLSLTAFANRFRDLINFETGPRCLPTQVFGCYVNVSRAVTSGLEASGRVTVTDWLGVSGNYTYLHAKDSISGLTLARRPQHQGRVALQITPVAGWLIEPSVVMVSGRFSGANETQRLAPYARLDIATEYQLNDRLKLHARIENVTDARYQEVRNYGTTGRAAYAGLTATW